MSEPTQGHLRRRVPPSRIVGLAVAFVSALATPASAQQSGQERRGQSIVRDAETEDLLRDYAVPIFQAAKVNAKATKIILVNDRSFNAFVANG